jgi:Holliday junction resolvase
MKYLRPKLKGMKEQEVKDFVVDYLKSNGWKIVTISPKRGRTPMKRRGRQSKAADPDIKARKGGQYYFVEAKGDPPNSNSLYVAIGQIVSKMAAKTPTTYAIALSPKYRKILHLLPREAAERVGIEILIPKEKTQSRSIPVVTEI